MPAIKRCSHPPDALLRRYVESGDYTDCYCTQISQTVSLEEFVYNFYTTPLFKLERWILGWAVSRPSTDDQLQQLLDQETENFAAWKLEARATQQMLMCDFRDRTRSWFMTEQLPNNSGTVLYFGSAVVKTKDQPEKEQSMPCVFSALLGFHKLYSIALLRSAQGRLQRARNSAESKL